MKIAELLQEEGMREYARRLKISHKIKEIGEGAYGLVFQHPKLKNVVVKVFDYKEDTAYMKFLNWAQKHQGNPYVPKIIEVHKMPEANHRVGSGVSYLGIVFMKKLKPCPKTVYHQLWVDAIEALRNSNDYKKDEEIKKVVEAAISKGNQKSKDLTFQALPRSVWVLLGKASPDKHFKEFANFMSSTDGGDLHDENVMMDTNGQIVFTDPLS